MEAIMEVHIRHRGDVRFEASTRGHRVVCDQPPDNGGSDSGMTPPEYLLVSLGTCAGFYAAQYMKARSLPHRGLEVKVRAERATQAGEECPLGPGSSAWSALRRVASLGIRERSAGACPTSSGDTRITGDHHLLGFTSRLRASPRLSFDRKSTR